MNSCFVDLLARQLYSWGKNVLLYCLKCTQKSALLSSVKSTHSNTEESNLPAGITLNIVDGWMAIAWQLFQLQIQSNPKANGTRVNTLYDGEMEEVRERKRCVKAEIHNGENVFLLPIKSTQTALPQKPYFSSLEEKTSLVEIWGSWKSLQKVHRIMGCGVHTWWCLLQPFSNIMPIHQSKQSSTLETLHIL